MTTQTAISAQSFGTSTNVGNGKFSIAPLTLAAGTMSVIVNAMWTNGVTPTNNDQTVRVWFATTPRTVTAGNAPAYLGADAQFVDVRPSKVAAGVSIKSSLRFPCSGVNFHCWADVPTLAVASTLDVIVAELT